MKKVIIIALMSLFFLNFFQIQTVNAVNYSVNPNEFFDISVLYKVDGRDWVDGWKIDKITEDDIVTIKANLKLKKDCPERSCSCFMHLYIRPFEKAYEILEGEEQVFLCSTKRDCGKCLAGKEITYEWKIKPTGKRISPEYDDWKDKEMYRTFSTELTVAMFFDDSMNYGEAKTEFIVFEAYITKRDDTHHPGVNPGEFIYPRDIHYGWDDRIYVADDGNRRIQVFDKDGNFLNEFGCKKQFSYFGVALSPDGSIYSCHTSNLYKYDYEGNCIKKMSCQVSDNSGYDIEITKDGVIVLGDKKIQKIIDEEKKPSTLFYSPGRGHISLGPDGKIYKISFLDYFFYILNPDGSKYKELRLGANDIEVTKDGEIYLLGSDYIEQYDENGNKIKKITIPITCGDFCTFTMDDEKNFYIAHYQKGKVYFIDSQGNLIKTIGPEQQPQQLIDNSDCFLHNIKNEKNSPGFEIVFLLLTIIFIAFIKTKRK